MIAPAIRNLFTRWLPHRLHKAEHQTDYQGLDEVPATLDAEYQRLIAGQLARWGVGDHLVSVEVQQGGRRKKPVFGAVLTIHGWERDAVLRVLVGLPLLEKKVRRAVADLWIAEIARTVSADKKQAEKRARPLGAGSLREVLGRLENLELEARVLSEHSLFSAGNSARLRSLQLQAEAARLNDAVYRMVLVRSDCDAVMRDLHDALHAASAHKQA